MERFVVGEIIVISFPFTDLNSSRKRPALILSALEGDDIVVCEITSKPRKDLYSVSLENNDLEKGKLKIKSIIRPNRLLTINKSKINYKFDKIKEYKLQEVLSKIKIIFKIE